LPGRGVFAHLLVANIGFGHGAAHSVGRECVGV